MTQGTLLYVHYQHAVMLQRRAALAHICLDELLYMFLERMCISSNKRSANRTAVIAYNDGPYNSPLHLLDQMRFHRAPLFSILE